MAILTRDYTKAEWTKLRDRLEDSSSEGKTTVTLRVDNKSVEALPVQLLTLAKGEIQDDGSGNTIRVTFEYEDDE